MGQERSPRRGWASGPRGSGHFVASREKTWGSPSHPSRLVASGYRVSQNGCVWAYEVRRKGEDMRALYLIRGLVFGVTLVGFSSLAEAKCTVQVEKGNVSIEEDGTVLAPFTVTPSNCSGHCHGIIDFRVYYRNKHGDIHFYARSTAWDVNTREQSSGDVTFKGYETYCNKGNLGPCEFRTLEVLRASCLD